MSRPVCGRAIRGGACAYLQGHKGMCRTTEQTEQYEAQQAQAEADSRAARRRRIEDASQHHPTEKESCHAVPEELPR